MLFFKKDKKKKVKTTEYSDDTKIWIRDGDCYTKFVEKTDRDNKLKAKQREKEARIEAEQREKEARIKASAEEARKISEIQQFHGNIAALYTYAINNGGYFVLDIESSISRSICNKMGSIFDHERTIAFEMGYDKFRAAHIKYVIGKSSVIVYSRYPIRIKVDLK